MKLNKRELMLLMNGVAITADVLSSQNEGKFPDSQKFNRIEEGQELGQRVYGDNPSIYYVELENLFIKLLDEALEVDKTEEEIDLATLPPTEYVQ
jgi:hypothetical protein